MRGRSTFIIAHRLSTAQMGDLIVVLDEGRLAEQGTHAELVHADGLDAAMLNEHRPRAASPTPEPQPLPT